MYSARIQLLNAILLLASTLVNVSVAFDSCLDPQTNEEIPVADLCAKYAPPTSDVFAVGKTVGGVCELFYYYHPGGPKTDKNCIPHGGIETTSEALFCRTGSCAAYRNDPTCAGQATLDGIPIQAPFVGGTPLPLINIWGPFAGTTATCKSGIDVLPQSK
ncbi:hypothetical protein GYMLUDRAFT_262008 [Collybiopsis luxurians FD-317 M1]|uniref:Autophagy-related protein n=1 Tax=Collybiopsis luxurians FD-317 M1 TaxID=944289 RepID=A0A0D0CUS1_9AGAR|nr:hypothetical protein GYMLUDRAFT_262008 [Collybiopsis luxurians FD-317 M1]